MTINLPSNLPPGVRVSDIPGNRPEDEWWEKFTDKVEVPSELMEDDPEKVAQAVNAQLSLLGAFLTLGFRQGLQEGRMTPFDDGLTKRTYDAE